MREAIIADTSCLIILQRIDSLELLQKLFHNIVVTPQVAKEYRLSLPDWVLVKSFKNQDLFLQLQSQVDLGEASAIVLATETADSLTILDDFKAREAAKKLGLEITGTLGIIIKAKERGIVTEVKPILNSLLEAGFRLDNKIYAEILKMTSEQ